MVTLRVCASRWTEVCGFIGSWCKKQTKMAGVFKIIIFFVIFSLSVECIKDKVFCAICGKGLTANKSQRRAQFRAASVNVSELPHPNPRCPDQIPSPGSATTTLPTPDVRTGVLPNLVEKQSLKKDIATQTEEHLPPFELAPSSTWSIVETCIGELMFGPRGYSLLPPELFQEIIQHIQELTKCRFPFMCRYYKTVEIVSNEKRTLNSNMPLYF